MSPQAPLAELLERALSPDELRDWLHEREGFLFFQALPDEDGILYREAAASLGRRGRVDLSLFEALLGLRPALREEVAAAAAAWGLSLTTRSLPSGLGLMRGEGLPPPEPDFSDDHTRDLSMQLDSLYERREQAAVEGEGVDEVDEHILRLRRKIRHGPHLHAGEFLDDGRYKLIEKVGQGGWGAVWKAYDRQARALVAVKVLHGHWSGERSRRERFRRGAAAMFRVQHQAVVRVLREAQEDGGFHFFVMELLRGGDLHAAVLQGALPAARCLEACLAVGEALVEAHALGLVHRDVKPHNILLDSRGRARLTDFDLVKDFDYSGSHTGSAMGTYRYAAPELLEDAKGADARADVYGLGMTVAFCLARQDPPREAVNDPQGFARSLAVGAQLREVIERALEPDPRLRWPSMAAFIEALAMAQGDLVRGPERSERVARLQALLAQRGADEAAAIEVTENIAEIVAALSPALELREGDEVLGVRLGAPLPLGPLGQGWWTEEQPPGVVLAMRGSQLAVPGAIDAFQAGERDLGRLAQRWSGRPWSAALEARSEDGLLWHLRLPLEPGAPWSTRPARPWREAMEEAAELCERLSAARASGVEALPLGPHGLLFDAERPGELVLVHALRPPAELVSEADLWGEAVFAPPEGRRAEGSAAEAGLVYRVGRLLHAALLGRSPGLASEADPWQDELSSFPPPVSLAVFKATAQAPEDRYSSLSQLRAALIEAARWTPPMLGDVEAHSAGRPERVQAPMGAGASASSGWRRAAASLAVAAAVIAVVGVNQLRVDPLEGERASLQEQLRMTATRVEGAERAAAQQELALLEKGAQALALSRRRMATGAGEADADARSALEDELAALEAEIEVLRGNKDAAADEAARARSSYTELQVEATRLELPAPQPLAPPPSAALAAPTLRWHAPRPDAGWPAMVIIEGASTRLLKLTVTLPTFAAASTEVTRGQYGQLMWSKGSRVPAPDEPVTGRSFCDALRFANSLSERDGFEAVYPNVPIDGCPGADALRWDITRRGYRLPTYDEWVAMQGVALTPRPNPEAQAPQAPGFEGLVGEAGVHEWLWDRCAGGRRLSPGAALGCLAPETQSAEVGLRLVLEVD